MRSKASYAEMALFLITVIWGLGFPITKIATSSGFGPSTIMFGRFLIASVLLFIIYFKRIVKMNSKVIIYGTITGVFLFLGFYFQTLGNVHTTASKNGFITQLNIVFVPYLYFLFFRKKVDIYNILSVIIAIIGLLVLSYSKDDFGGINIGDVYTLICAVMVAFNVVTGSYYQKKYDFDPAIFVFVNIFVTFLLSVIFMVTTETPPVLPIFDYWPIVFLGILNTGLGFLVQSYALKYSLPTRVSLIVTMESIFAAIGAYFIIAEKITNYVIVGGLLIIIGVVISELKPFKNNEIKR